MLFTWKQIMSFKESVVSYYLPTIFACVQCRFRFSYQIFGSVTRDLYFDYISSCLMTQSNQFVPWQLWSTFGSEALLVFITILSRPVWNMLFTWKQILSFIENVRYVIIRFSYEIFGSVTRGLCFDYISSYLMTQSNQFVPWRLWSTFLR